MKASVKVMRSYDYNHFEVCLSDDIDLTIVEVNRMRIQAAKLVDRAIEDYKKFKAHENKQINDRYKRDELERKAKTIKENYPKSEWTPEQMATVKAFEDYEWESQFNYDDEWNDVHQN